MKANNMIGQFKKVRQLGKGASGSVWLCEKDGFQYAVKILDPMLMQDEHSIAMDMFGNEVEIAEKLDHPNIIKMYGHYITDDAMYIVMEFIDGGAMDKFSTEEHLLPPQEIIRYGIDLCDAMEFASNAGFIHCDIKPSNVMLSSTGIVKLSDFGAGMKMKNGFVKPDVVLGSPAYMSPEHMQGLEMTTRSDMYSFGAMLYRLLTGRLPFNANTDDDIIHSVLHTAPVDPRRYNKQIPDMIARVIMRCLAKSPMDRYDSWGDIKTDLMSIDTTSDKHLERIKTIRKHRFFANMTQKTLWDIANIGEINNQLTIGQMNFIIEGAIYSNNGKVVADKGDTIGGDLYLAKISTAQAAEKNFYKSGPGTLILSIDVNNITKLPPATSHQFNVRFFHYLSSKLRSAKVVY